MDLDEVDAPRAARAPRRALPRRRLGPGDGNRRPARHSGSGRRHTSSVRAARSARDGVAQRQHLVDPPAHVANAEHAVPYIIFERVAGRPDRGDMGVHVPQARHQIAAGDVDAAGAARDAEAAPDRDDALAADQICRPVAAALASRDRRRSRRSGRVLAPVSAPTSHAAEQRRPAARTGLRERRCGAAQMVTPRRTPASRRRPS